MPSNLESDERILGGAAPAGRFSFKGPQAAGSHASWFHAEKDFPSTAAAGGLLAQNRYQLGWLCSQTVGLSFAPWPITLPLSGSPRARAVVLLGLGATGGQFKAIKSCQANCRNPHGCTPGSISTGLRPFKAAGAIFGWQEGCAETGATSEQAKSAASPENRVRIVTSV